MPDRPDRFPTTDWGSLANVRSSDPAVRQASLEILIRRYWKPVFSFLRGSGHDEESAKDLTQAFFADWIESNDFAKADQRRGRFRSFMLSCLKRFVANQHRAENAQKRRPKAGILSLDELMDNTQMPFQPADGMSPDVLFDRTWAAELVLRVLNRLEHDCRQRGQEIHFDIFAQRVINPILHGFPEPSLVEVGRQHGLTQKQAANRMEPMKDAYRKLMEEELRLYASSEGEVASEVRELFRILGKNQSGFGRIGGENV